MTSHILEDSSGIQHTQPCRKCNVLGPLKMYWYFLSNVMMNDGEKRWPIFLLYNYSSCK